MIPLIRMRSVFLLWKSWREYTVHEYRESWQGGKSTLHSGIKATVVLPSLWYMLSISKEKPALRRKECFISRQPYPWFTAGTWL